VLIRKENLSKYVFVLSFEKYAPKLQKIIETKSHKVKKVAKRDKISPFENYNSIKMTKLMVNQLRIQSVLPKHYPSPTKAVAILMSKAVSSLKAEWKLARVWLFLVEKTVSFSFHLLLHVVYELYVRVVYPRSCLAPLLNGCSVNHRSSVSTCTLTFIFHRLSLSDVSSGAEVLSGI